MKIIIAIMQYDYGVKSRGYSYEYYNLYLPLTDLYGKENIILFDFKSKYDELGKKGMNDLFVDLVKKERPDVSVFSLFENEFDERSINELKNYTRTVNYFLDDTWRKDYVSKWIKYFDFFTTSDFYMYKQYESNNINNSVYSPFGFNTSIYKKVDTEFKYDVSFVGGYSPYRKWLVELLRKEGISVKVFGRKWGKMGTWVEQNEMVNIFNQSKINLNLSNGIIYDLKYLIWSLRSSKAIKHNLTNRKTRELVKGRHYEINACGGFQISYFVPGLNFVYEIDKEIAVFENERNLADQIKFYLNNENLRTEIAEAGYNRSLAEHSAQQRMKTLIETVISNPKQ